MSKILHHRGRAKLLNFPKEYTLEEKCRTLCAERSYILPDYLKPIENPYTLLVSLDYNCCSDAGPNIEGHPCFIFLENNIYEIINNSPSTQLPLVYEHANGDLTYEILTHEELDFEEALEEAFPNRKTLNP